MRLAVARRARLCLGARGRRSGPRRGGVLPGPQPRRGARQRLVPRPYPCRRQRRERRRPERRQDVRLHRPARDLDGLRFPVRGQPVEVVAHRPFDRVRGGGLGSGSVVALERREPSASLVLGLGEGQHPCAVGVQGVVGRPERALPPPRARGIAQFGDPRPAVRPELAVAEMPAGRQRRPVGLGARRKLRPRAARVQLRIANRPWHIARFSCGARAGQRCTKTELDARRPGWQKDQQFGATDLSAGVRGGMCTYSFKAGTRVRSPLGTPAISNG